MRRRLTLLATPLVLALGVCGPADAADTIVAELERPSTIRTYGGIQVFSAFDGGAYRLAILRDGRLERVPVPSSQAPFDVDIGPDSSGRPQLVYTRCRLERPSTGTGTNESEGCDLVVFALSGGRGGERPVRGANTTDGSEFAPTVWKGRIAFARRVEGRDRPAVYTRRLAAPRSERSVRLPGIARRTRTRGIMELELHGRNLAQIVFFAGQTEVRLVDVTRRWVRRLARTGVGEGGQYFAGIGFAAGHLAWVSGWVGGGGAVRPGVYRHRLATGGLARAPLPTILRTVVGLALIDADGAFLADADPPDDGCGTTLGDPAAPRPCRLVRSEPLDFRPVGQLGT